MKFQAPLVLCSLGMAYMAVAQVTLDWSTINDPGNPPHPTTTTGSVPYAFDVSKYETTIAQYTAFLNAVAASDPHNLWKSQMESDLNIAGIARTGTHGSYVYSVIGSGDRPIAYITYADALRFANWLHNGQAAGDTETGAYTLRSAVIIAAERNQSATTFTTAAPHPFIPEENVIVTNVPGFTNSSSDYKVRINSVTATTFSAFGAFPIPLATGLNGSATSIPTRNAGARFWVPNLNEWFKASFYQPTNAGGDPDGYWLYATHSNTFPGNVIGATPNQANISVDTDNFSLRSYSVTQSTDYDPNQNYLTAVGAYSGTASYYGTFDLAGNVAEWVERSDDPRQFSRLGGAWDRFQSISRSDSPGPGSTPPPSERSNGFRVAGNAGPFIATPTPEPAPAPNPAPIADSTPPELKIRGRATIETLRKRVVIRGTASDASGIAELEVKARGAKARKVKLLSGDRFKVVLLVTKTRGRVVVKLRAIDNANNRSKKAKLRILRR